MTLWTQAAKVRFIFMVWPLRNGRKLWREEEFGAIVVGRSHLRSGCPLLVVFSHQVRLLILSNTVSGNMTGLVYKLPVHKKKKPLVLLVRIRTHQRNYIQYKLHQLKIVA